MAPAAGPCVLMHFGMTGLLNWTSDGEDHPHDRLVFDLENGKVRYRNMRRFGGVWLARSAADVKRITGPLGPDAMSLDRKLREVIAASNRRGRIPPIEGWLTGARDKRDARCPRCDAPLRRSTVAGRTACWWPRCQRQAMT